MKNLSPACRKALAIINQAPPIGLETVDLWKGGWCRLHVKTPQGAPRIASATYLWLKDQGLIQETLYGRPMTRGTERNRRYATLTDAGRALLCATETHTERE